MLKIAPSILSADFTKLGEQISLAEKGGADWIHIDVMDGKFVPNISMGQPIVKSVRKATKLPLDTHLMIVEPDRYLESFKDAGTDRLTVHVEACVHLHRTVEQIKKLGMKAGVALNPATPAEALEEILEYADLILVMTVNPGFGGQKFIKSMLPKITEISEMIEEAGSEALIEVDGGVDETNAQALAAAGANVFVAGNSIFSKKNIPSAVRELRKAVL
ncbi:MAG TPA: ribulose-phosphate 3-epimerase [Bacteroidota bacterium]|nr:ribulose-phosphate 3-epimerase [Bacteroidota bacterium]